MDDWYKKMIDAEINAASKLAIREAEYNLSDETAIKLYDCLLPTLHDYLPSKPTFREDHIVQRYKRKGEEDNFLAKCN